MLSLSFPDFFIINFFQKILPEKLSECQMVWIQIRTNVLSPNCLQRLCVDNKSRCYQGKQLDFFFPEYHQGHIVRIKLIPNVCQAFSGSKLFAGFIKFDFMLKVV